MKISHTFQNGETCLHISMMTSVNHCSSERSFLFLKRFKYRLTSSMNREKLDAFGILSIENDFAAKINSEEVIDAIARKNVYKIL